MIEKQNLTVQLAKKIKILQLSMYFKNKFLFFYLCVKGIKKKKVFFYHSYNREKVSHILPNVDISTFSEILTLFDKIFFASR